MVSSKMRGGVVALGVMVGCYGPVTSLIQPNPPAPKASEPPRSDPNGQGIASLTPTEVIALETGCPARSLKNVTQASTYQETYVALCGDVEFVCRVSVFASGCVQRQSPTPDMEALAWAKQSGAGVIFGSVFARTVGGDVRIGAGESVWLLPYDPSLDYVLRATQLGLESTLRDPALEGIAIEATARSNGSFRFEGLPFGTYIVLSQLYWYTGKEMTGGGLYAVVKLKPEDKSKSREVFLLNWSELKGPLVVK